MRLLRLSLLLLLVGLYTFVSSSLLIFHGPFSGLREYIIDSFTTSRHGYLLRPLSLFTLSQKVIDEHNPNLSAGAGRSSEQESRDFRSLSGDNRIEYKTYTGKTFTAQILLVHNPLRLQVAVTGRLGDVGESVSDMVQEHHAVAGVNGGAFQDVGWHGTGGVPLGITISNGKVVQASSNQQSVIGLTAQGALIVGDYTLDQLEALHVTNALTFGPVLIQDGKVVVQGDGGWGYAPRTAIGQTADGTIILMVTDGRFVHGPGNVGASLAEVAQLMQSYGAVVAANLDGGSSSTMVYNGKLINDPTDILGERKVATAWIVTR
ncbi:exopolysaccharide biosynthesis protein [Alicyclobacillus contaminans]|uniref:phosphodiester glycosidase family protein n=1 Tax=Alicyclobacillus contaminans TaxID=392016 RepID=UPI00041330E2|nr:phosphodiester glycosidase family protein [Alicyclobacillus contaminans]GMA51066.1 exopolysaccharide biosynthesis protein [Alicyclobacillus contaminans]